MISAIVCVDDNWGIGYKNNLLTKIPEDMKRFKELTIGNTVIMGRTTYDFLPVKPLKDRTNVIITHDTNSMRYGSRHSFPMDLDNIKMFLSTCKYKPTNNDYFIIGGGQIYNELLDYCDMAYVTKVNRAFKNVDTYFPNLDKLQKWELVEEVPTEISSNGESFSYCTYKKK